MYKRLAGVASAEGVGSAQVQKVRGAAYVQQLEREKIYK